MLHSCHSVVPATRKATGKPERTNMKNTTVGVDPTVSSTSSAIPYTSDGPVSSSDTHSHPKTHQEHTEPHKDCEECAAVPAVPYLARPEHVGTVCQVVNGIVTPSFQILLASVLGSVDASIPNKEQNRAVKHIIRKQFDDAYLNIQKLSYPDVTFGGSAEYYLEPNPKAFQQGTIRQ